MPPFFTYSAVAGLALAYTLYRTQFDFVHPATPIQGWDVQTSRIDYPLKCGGAVLCANHDLCWSGAAYSTENRHFLYTRVFAEGDCGMDSEGTAAPSDCFVEFPPARSMYPFERKCFRPTEHVVDANIVFRSENQLDRMDVRRDIIAGLVLWLVTPAFARHPLLFFVWMHTDSPARVKEYMGWTAFPRDVTYTLRQAQLPEPMLPYLDHIVDIPVQESQIVGWILGAMFAFTWNRFAPWMGPLATLVLRGSMFSVAAGLLCAPFRYAGPFIHIALVIALFMIMYATQERAFLEVEAEEERVVAPAQKEAEVESKEEEEEGGADEEGERGEDEEEAVPTPPPVLKNLMMYSKRTRMFFENQEQ